METPNKEDDLPVWRSGKVTYTPINVWSDIAPSRIEACKRCKPKGVEGHLLTAPHPLKGEYGLFATQKFSRFDVVGEYVGRVVNSEVTGHYVAALEDTTHDESVGLNAEFEGNEMRFINSYMGVAERSNAVMKTAYIDFLPHIIIICTEDILPGQEILLDYGEEYNNAYLRPAPVSRAHQDVTVDDLHYALPFCDSDSETERDDAV
jgi:hypothetical protein